MRIKGYLTGLFLMLVFLSACNKEKTDTLVFDNIVISAEGPLFEGANTAQGEVLNLLNAFAKEKGIEPGAIRSASLRKFTLLADDTSDFDLFSSINIQFASDKTDMIEAAAVNKIPSGSKQLELTLSGKQEDLIEMLRQDKFIVVADAIIGKDLNANIGMKGRMEIELKY